MNTVKKIFVYGLEKLYIALACRKKEIRTVYHYDREELKDRPVVLVADHSSFDNFTNVLYDFDFSFDLVPVIDKCESRDPVLGRLMTLFENVHKRMYTSDLPAAHKMFRIAKSGKSLLIFPEGIYSYCGVTHPISPVMGGFLKQLGLDVIVASTKGAFLSTPRYSKDVKRGPVQIDYYHFSKESLKEMTGAEVFDELMRHLSFNDFKWNAEHHYHYIGKVPNVTGLEKVIYHCPCCGEDGQLSTKDDCIVCAHCGNTVRMDDTYAIEPASEKDVLPYARVDEWFYDQRRLLRKAIRENENYSIVMDTELNVLNTIDRSSMFRPVGKGKVTIDRTGITYDGEKDGESTRFTIPIRETWGASNLHDHFMAIVYNGEPLAFDIFSSASEHIIKACSAVEEFHALINEQWDAGLQRVYS